MHNRGMNQPLAFSRTDRTASSRVPLLRKPKFGVACNGCGYCCSTQPCALATNLIGALRGPCPALEQADGRTYCGLVRRPSHYLAERAALEAPAEVSVLLASMLGLGLGCDADDDSESEKWSRGLISTGDCA